MKKLDLKLNPVWPKVWASNGKGRPSLSGNSDVGDLKLLLILRCWWHDQTDTVSRGLVGITWNRRNNCILMI